MPAKPTRTSAFRLGAALVSLSLALLSTSLATPQAHAAGRGQVCFFLDTDSAGGAGHAGWAVKDTARADHTSYDLLTNNCLTGAGEIFRAYSPAMSTRHLPDGLGGRPNGVGLSPTYYIKTRLTSHASGWGPVNRY
ncbi:hypothetical protein ACIQ62_00930 [Streptomyces sp. NPDC096319]|uniref:hypothetical protein n=1 Tax=Streptomyces sp. NPDC096319 TaxID=3366084 RepID=UPI003824B977